MRKWMFLIILKLLGGSVMGESFLRFSDADVDANGLQRANDVES